MTSIRWFWLSIGSVYIAFFGWYTSFGGPLTEQEIEHYLKLFQQRGVAEEQAAMLEQFMRSDTGDDFVMLNNIDMYGTPLQVEGVEPGDIIRRFGQRRVDSAADLAQLVAETLDAGRSGVLLLIERDGRERFVQIGFAEK